MAHILKDEVSMKKKKLPADANQRAKSIVDITTKEYAPPETKKDPAAVALGRKGGLKGGAMRAAKLSPEERSKIAKKAAQARWANKDSKGEE